MTPVQAKNRIIAEGVIKNLEKRNIQGFYCETKADALEKALSIIKEGSVVTWGGSESIKEIGLIDAINNGNYQVLDRSKAETPEQVKEMYRQAFSADYFLASSNAVTLDGELVNIDGTGNRIAAMIYGPENVILIVGINKLADDEAAAVKRIRREACVPNTIRLGIDTPCKATGKCHDCLGNTICCQILTTRYSRIKDRIKVILVGENIGY